MDTLARHLTGLVSEAFRSAGFDPRFGAVAVSDRPDLAQFQCNGALPAAKTHRRKPRDIALEVVAALEALGPGTGVARVTIAGPGFINLDVEDAFLAAHVTALLGEPDLGCRAEDATGKVFIDYGGPNVAKPMHVGHLRASIIGESLKRISRALGYVTVGDVHLGDWGLQMGMLIEELERREPDLPYFDETRTDGFPSQSPVSIHDLQDMYPEASARAKADPAVMDAARAATRELQAGRAGYRALWRHFVEVSVSELRQDFESLGVTFDLWLGESDTADAIGPLVARLRESGDAVESEGALVIEVAEPGDKDDVPPLILTKSDGAALYGTTDLATIEQRVREGATAILYVVDNRQGGHFRQVFRAARKVGIAPETVVLEHVGFGTMNGPDGKPFKTREGGTMRLSDLVAMVTRKARDRMAEADVGTSYSDDEKDAVARKVGMAALKYADLVSHRTKDYVFDLDRFSAFEGRTGPYLLYVCVRIESILRKASERGLDAGALLAPASDAERDVLLELAKLPDVVRASFDARAPSHVAEYAFQLATAFNRFYKDHHILREENAARRGSWLALSSATGRVLGHALGLLGLEVPERM